MIFVIFPNITSICKTSINHKFYKAYYNLGNIYQFDQKYDKAIEYYLAYTRDVKDNADAYYSLGEIYQDMGEPEDAIENYCLSLKIKESRDRSCMVQKIN